MSDIKEIFATVRKYCGMMFGDAKMQRCEEAKSVSEAAKQLGSGTTHVAHCDKLRRAAFTLAEVLITLGIIGVVAALTLPTLIQNHQKQVYVTQLKKAYSTLGNAFNKMAVDEDVVDWKQTNCGSSLDSSTCIDALTKQLNIINKKYTTDTNLVWADGFADPAFLTNDGALFLFACHNVDQILVDVNGVQKSPNKYGRDRFAFYVDYEHNKIIPYGTEEMVYTYDTVPEWSDCDVEDGYPNALSCTAKVIIEGKMNY